jgi:hypothetical protein
MTCGMQVGDTVELVENTAQTGTITRMGSLGTHSHVVTMNAGPLYPAGKKIAYFGHTCRDKIRKI